LFLKAAARHAAKCTRGSERVTKAHGRRSRHSRPHGRGIGPWTAAAKEADDRQEEETNRARRIRLGNSYGKVALTLLGHSRESGNPGLLFCISYGGEVDSRFRGNDVASWGPGRILGEVESAHAIWRIVLPVRTRTAESQPSTSSNADPKLVIPSKEGIQAFSLAIPMKAKWVPAFAGMTAYGAR